MTQCFFLEQQKFGISHHGKKTTALVFTSCARKPSPPISGPSEPGERFLPCNDETGALRAAGNSVISLLPFPFPVEPATFDHREFCGTCSSEVMTPVVFFWQVPSFFRLGPFRDFRREGSASAPFVIDFLSRTTTIMLDWVVEIKQALQHGVHPESRPLR